jgi:hypothetical protein
MVATTTLLMPPTIIAVILTCWVLFDTSVVEEEEEGNGIPEDWCGTNILNNAKLTEFFVSSLVIAWCVTSSKKDISQKVTNGDVFKFKQPLTVCDDYSCHSIFCIGDMLAGCCVLDAEFKLGESINNGLFRFISELDTNFIIWIVSATSALRINSFDGIQPLLRQVPPILSFQLLQL